MIKTLKYILALTLLFSCSTVKELEKEKRILTIQSNGRSIIKPDIFVTYLNIERRPVQQEEINCSKYRDSIIDSLKELLKRNNQNDYIIEKAVLKQNQAYSVKKGDPEKLLGNYCQSALALTLFDQKDFDLVYPKLLNPFEVATREFFSSKIDSLNIEAYKNAIQNANSLANHLLEDLGAKSKKLIRVTNVITPEENNHVFYKVNDFPSWIYGDSFLRAIDLLQKSYVQAEREIIIEYEIK